MHKWICLLMTLCLLFTAAAAEVTADAVEEATKLEADAAAEATYPVQTVVTPVYAFELPADMMLSSPAPGNIFTAQRENCLLQVYSFIYEDVVLDAMMEHPQGEQVGHFVMLMTSVFPAEYERMLGFLGIQQTDIGCPNEETVITTKAKAADLLGDYGTVICTQLDMNAGFLLSASKQGSGMTDAELTALVHQIARSVRVENPLVKERVGYAVVIDSSAYIRSAPDAGADKIRTAFRDERFLCLGEENGWYRIDVDGQTGYISQRLCKIEY